MWTAVFTEAEQYVHEFVSDNLIPAGLMVYLYSYPGMLFVNCTGSSLEAYKRHVTTSDSLIIVLTLAWYTDVYMYEDQLQVYIYDTVTVTFVCPMKSLMTILWLFNHGSL